MKKAKAKRITFIPLIVTLSIYVVFYSKIESTPNHPGFWFILALGISIGLVLARVFNKRI